MKETAKLEQMHWSYIFGTLVLPRLHVTQVELSFESRLRLTFSYERSPR